MHAASSSSLSLSEKTKKRPSPPTPSPTPSPPKKVVPRRKGDGFIEKEQDRKKTQKKWSNSVVDKAKKYNSLTRAPVTAITFNPKDELCSFGSPSVEEVFLMYLRKKYDLKQQVIPKEWLDWAKKESDSCKTKEECTSMIMKHQVALNCLCERLKYLKNSPSVNANASQGSGVRAGRDLSTLDSTEDRDDHDHPLTSPNSTITREGSSTGISNPMRSDPHVLLAECNFYNYVELDPNYRFALQQWPFCLDPEGHENDGFDLFAI